MTNPFESPDPYSRDPSPWDSPPDTSTSTIVKVKVLAILMIVQGALEAILGVLLLLAGLFITSFAAEILAAQQRQGGQAKMPTEEMLMVYAILGAALLVLAGIRIFAGIRNLSFRGRTLGIIAVSAGLLTSITCYCAPTSVGLMIYGLIVYLNGNVAETFRACEAGMPPPTG